jgi:L-rhamnose-H+ transport protein
MSGSALGVLLALAGGVCVGNCMLPLKRVRTWPWECTWLVFSLVSLILVPCLIAYLVIPGWPHLYGALPPASWLPSFLLGAGWGVAQVLFGISVVRLGMSLAFTLIVGLGTIFGTLIPLVTLHRSYLFSHNSAVLIAGCGIMCLGIIFSGIAGKMRERRPIAAPPKESTNRTTDSAYLASLAIAVLSGVLSAMLNLSLAFGGSISQAAFQRGTDSSMVSFAVWPVALAGGFIPNFAYTAWLLSRNRSWKLLSRGLHDASLSMLMGLLWIGAVAIYGIATRYLGRLGDSAGWAIYQIAMVLTANIGGVISGEWRGASRRSRAMLWGGVLVLILATVTTAFSTR